MNNYVKGGIYTLIGALSIGGVAGIWKLASDAEREREEEKKRFEIRKDALLSPLSPLSRKISFDNEKLSTEDAAYVYKKALKLYSNASAASSDLALDKKVASVTEFISHFTESNSQKAIDSYLLYLRNSDEEALKRAEIEEARRAESQKYAAEQKALEMKLSSEEKKSENMIRALEAITGANKPASDTNVNVNVNNDTKKED